MMGFPIEIKLANVLTVQCLHDANAREHRRPAERGDEDQRFRSRLPFRGLVLSLRKLRDILTGILERDELATAGQRSTRRTTASSPTRHAIVGEL